MREHSAKLKLISMLTSGEFYSGEKLGAELGISRAAISKHIKGIINWGLDIHSVQGKGYRLSVPLELLNIDSMRQYTNQEFELIPVIDSTNQYLMDRIGSLSSGSVCIAEYQSSGRGRRGRKWISPFGSNLYLSMYWRLEAGMAASMGLSLVVGVAVVEALEQLGIPGIKLKWPNDLYYQDRKLAGILVEMTGQAGGAAYLVIGMGINIQMNEAIEGIDQPWISLAEISEHPIERNKLAASLMNAWSDALTEYEAIGMTGFVERWNRFDNFINRPARLVMGSNEVSGVVRGINEQGAVLIETKNGIESYIGGEISLRY